MYLKKIDLYPIEEKIEHYSEEDLFDVIEFLHDFCSDPYHGYDYYLAEKNRSPNTPNPKDEEGKKYYRQLVNPILKDYGSGYSISEEGKILQFASSRFPFFFHTAVPSKDYDDIISSVNGAINAFRMLGATTAHRQNAIRDLVDVLALLRKKAKPYLRNKDEAVLFLLADKYGVTLHNKRYKDDYDIDIWQSWKFYQYLSTIHTLLRIINKNENGHPKQQ